MKTRGATSAPLFKTSAREGGSNHPYHRKHAAVAGQSGSMYVSRATFMELQFWRYMIFDSITPIALCDDAAICRREDVFRESL